MLKSVDTVVSATFACGNSPYTSETPENRVEHLTGPEFHKHWYQPIWCIVSVLVPMRYPSTHKLWHIRRTQLMLCGTSDIRTCIAAIAVATQSTQSRMSISTYWLARREEECETAGSERGVALTRQASPFARRTEKRVGHDLPSLCATQRPNITIYCERG
jgi:hypothetical protein